MGRTTTTAVIAMVTMLAAGTCAAVPAGVKPVISDPEVQTMVKTMWHELNSYCAAGRCALAKGSHRKFVDIANTTDCKGRMLAYEYGLGLLPDRKPQLESFDALELAVTCGVTRPTKYEKSTKALKLNVKNNKLTVHVCPQNGDDNAHGTKSNPFRTIRRALYETRKVALSGDMKNIVLNKGVHFLNETIALTSQDSGLSIEAAPGLNEGDVVVSGGVMLSPKWTKSPVGNQTANIWVTDVPELAGIESVKGLTTLDPHRRVTRAREPSADPSEGAELCTRCWNNGVKYWKRDMSCVGKAKTVYIDLRNCNDEHKLPDGSPCKNDSAMWDTYNTYSNGHGGCCAAWSGDMSPYGPMGNYFCGNSSAGGWVGFDDPRGDNHSQGLSAQLPVGFEYDPTDTNHDGPFLASIKNAAGAIMHVWRDQGWFVNMFEVATNDGQGNIDFAMTESYGVKHVKGGWQGGRGWQINGSAINETNGPDNYLLAGKWMIENVFEALDYPNEWFYNATEGKLYLIPNATVDEWASGNHKPPSTNTDYVAVVLETLISINGTKADPVKNVTVQGITFRDAADITMNPWGVPSGGDWGLYRGGAIFIEGAEGVTVQHNVLTRLDGNGVFVSGYTRDVMIADNHFSWIGDSPMAAWGYTKENDGMDGQQPRETSIFRNYVHEFGHYEKQSSFWFQAKACLTQIEGNIVFNGPRAGINFNDGFGGGTNVTQNLIYNQCRESGDHGAMNSWDRTAYISDVKYGTPSYTAQMNSVDTNFIIANYGASQGFDTDDGSSWYDIHDNFFFMADAWKMDYGGHDSVFTDNLVYHGHNDGQNCVNTWPFLPYHGAEWKRNKCILPKSNNIAGSIASCDCPGSSTYVFNASDPEADPGRMCGVSFADNEYFTHNASATVNRCGDFDTVWKPKNEPSSNISMLPSDDQLLDWARAKLGM